jgi:hypothetical protein
VNIGIDTLWTSSYRSDWIVPRKIIISNVLFDVPAGGGQMQAILTSYTASPGRTVIEKDEVLVYNFNQTPGDSFRLFYLQQSPDSIVPQSILNSDGSPSLEGAPAAGLTNQQNWVLNGIAIAGAVAPCATTRAGIVGYTCPIGGAPVTVAPAPPTNVRVLR